MEEIEEGPHVIIVDLQKPLGRDVRAVMEDKYQPTKCWVENTSWVRHCIRHKRYEHNPPEYKNTPGRRPRTRGVVPGPGASWFTIISRPLFTML